jgi:hypothetical protein
MDLHEAARCGDVVRVKELLDAGVDVDTLDRSDNTPLHLACFSEVHHPEVVALLRERGADPHRRNIHLDTPRTQAHERYLMSGFDPLGDLPAPDPPKTEADQLTEEEMAVTAAAVRAVVEGDRAALEAMKAYDAGDPYEWTHEYGRWGDVHLVLPPGDPRTWTINVYRRDGDDAWLAVEVDMWTREEGRSDLTLQLDLWRQPDGSLRAEFNDLHVM